MMRNAFGGVLIANRGEIAVRIARACRELALRPIAVYSDADRDALHVQACALAVRLGPPPAPESYLNVDAILRAAAEVRARPGTRLRVGRPLAVHPGYGFLSENAAFARACLDAGLVWVGPPPEAISAMGDKVRAKQLMREAGVPVVPGWEGDSTDLDQAEREIGELPLPLMVKAAAGGGGRGMREVRERGELRHALEAARREALAAFGDGRLFVERYVERPRHVEFQVLADAHGNVVHLGERECSIQRRHQKIVEEAPSPALTPELRAEMGAAAVRAARAVGYVNAGTIEFILDADGRYYFLEMNTRLQVEHPVTELVTGLDLVHLQLRIAAGEPLPLDQSAVSLRGHAIECRLYAEDPEAGFLPSTGRLAVFAPPIAPGVRHDVGYYPGAEVSPWYDPMLAKLIVHAPDRPAAIARAVAALGDYGVLGVRTNRDFLRSMLAAPEFVAGETDTDLVDRLLSSERDVPRHAAEATPTDDPATLAVAALALLGADGAGADSAATAGWAADPWRGSGWRGTGHYWTVHLRRGEAEVRVEARPAPEPPGAWELRLPADRSEGAGDDDHPSARTWHCALVRLQRLGDGEYALSGRLDAPPGEGGAAGEAVGEGSPALGPLGRYFVALSRDEVAVQSAAGTISFTRVRPLDESEASGQATVGAGGGSLNAPMPGRIVKLHVAEGERVRAQQPLLVLEAMKMEHAVTAPYDGVVRRLPHGQGETVAKGALLVEIEPV